MRLDVQIIGNRALIECVPSIVERILFGRAAVDRYAVLGIGGRWTFDDSGRAVDPLVQLAIDAARKRPPP